MNPTAYQLAVAASLRADGDAAGADAIMALSPGEVADILLGTITPPAPPATFAEWQPYTGPEGGRGWTNGREVRYQPDKPDDDDGTGGGTDPQRQDIAPGLTKGSRVIAGATAGGLVGSALGGPLGMAVGTVAGAALGTDTGKSILGGIRALLNRGEEPEGIARKVTAGDPEAVAAVRADATEQVRHAAGELAKLPPADPAEVRGAWAQASAKMRAGDAAELGSHVEAMATAREPGAIEAAFRGVGGFLSRLTGGALRLAFGAIKAFSKAAFASGKPFLKWAGALAVGAAVMAAPPVAVGLGLIGPTTALAIAPFAFVGGYKVADIASRRVGPDYAPPAAEQFAELHTFAGGKWQGPFKGERGGTYWLPEGAEDSPGNRVYGAKPGAAAGPQDSRVDKAVGKAIGAGGAVVGAVMIPEVHAATSAIDASWDAGQAAGELVTGKWDKKGRAAKAAAVQKAGASAVKAAGWATVEHVKDDPAGALEFIKHLAGLAKSAAGFSEGDPGGPPPNPSAPGEPGQVFGEHHTEHHTEHGNALHGNTLGNGVVFGVRHRTIEQFAETADYTPAGPDGKRAVELLATTQAAGVNTLTEVADRAVRRLLMLPNPEHAAHLFEDDELHRIAGALAGGIATADLLGRSRVRRRAEMAERVQRFAEQDDPGPPGPPPRPGLTWKKETQRWIRKGTDHAKALTQRAKEAPAKLKSKVRSYVEKKYAKLAERYGERGAKAIMAASILMLPVPVPGASFVPIALAEAVRAIGKGIDRFSDEPVTDEMVQAVIDFLVELYADAGEEMPEIDAARVRAALERDEVDEDEVETFAEKPGDDPWHDFAEPVPAVEPQQAVDYFRRLVPSLADDPGRYGTMLGRHAFTLAVATEQTLLQKVKDAILTGLRAGTDGTADVQDVLDAAGVSPRNPQYAEMVFRTNTMDALNAGAVAEMQTPEMQEAFPVWRYDGILDSRTGDDHRPLIGRHYPSTANFADVRGARVFNCRCSPTPVWRGEAADLIRAGKVERG